MQKEMNSICKVLSRRPTLIATGHYHPIESGLQDFRRPFTLSLPIRWGEGGL